MRAGDVTAPLAALLGSRTRVGEPLARHTSLRVGGPADVLVQPDTPEELSVVLRTAAGHGVPVTMLGGGSNLLVGDGGIRGVVVKLGRGFRAVARDGDLVRAGAAVQMGRLARETAALGLAGLEHGEGIPGTVGGAIRGNAGAYGGDVASVLERICGVDEHGTLCELPRASVAFDYRRAALPARFVVTAAVFRLRPDDPAAVLARLEHARARRTAAQPQGVATAGSIFKNPRGDHAGRLIEMAGLKGRRIGHARISDRHANWIVNEGRALAADVQALMTMAQRAVWERSGVWLEPEVRLIGTW